MTRKVSNFSDLIQRVTANCLLHPLAAGRYDAAGEDKEENSHSEAEETMDHEEEISDEDEETFEEESDELIEEKMVGATVLKVKQMEAIMDEVFETVSSLKRAYVRLQEAHSPWDPERMRLADVAVVAELRKLASLRERFGRSSDGGTRRRRGNGGGGCGGGVSVREVVAPYEAVVEELKKEVKAKESEVKNLREKLESAVAISGSNGSGEKKSGRSQSKRKLGIQGKLIIKTTFCIFWVKLSLTKMLFSDRYEIQKESFFLSLLFFFWLLLSMFY